MDPGSTDSEASAQDPVTPEPGRDQRVSTTLVRVADPLALSLRITAWTLAVAIVVRTAAASGWPRSHEQNFFFTRVDIYAAHIRRFDVLPIWSSSDQNEFGTPLPFFYHKTFYLAAGVLRAAGIGTKLAVCITIVVLLIVGFELSRRAFQMLSGEPLFSSLAAVAYVYASYSLSNLIVRGSMAEFTFTMLLPSLVSWLMRWLIERRWSYSIVVIVPALFFSHNALTVAALLLFGVAVVPVIVGDRAAIVRDSGRRILISATAVLALLAPYVYVYARLAGSFDPTVVTEEGYLPTNNFRPIADYFSVPDWFADWFAINFSILTILPLVVAMTGVAIWREARIEPLRTRLGLTIALMLAIPALLQLRWSAPLYRVIGPLDFIQFPWRLITFVVLGTLITACHLYGKLPDAAADPTGAPRIAPRRVLVIAAGASMLATVVWSPAVSTASAQRLPIPRPAADGVGDSLIGIGEYLPKLGRDDSAAARRAAAALHADDSYASQGACVILRRPADFESAEITFDYSCSGPASVVLPVYYSALHDATDNGADIHLYRRPDDGRSRVDLRSGTGVLTIVTPSLWQMVFG